MMVDKLLQLVSFNLGEGIFAAPIAKVQEIIRYAGVVKIPRSPDFIEGIINLRGKVVPVIDLRRRFAVAGPGATGRIIIAEIDGVRVGLAVDSVSSVVRASEDKFEATPAIVAEMDRKFVKGVVKNADRMLIVIDVDSILTDKERELLKTLN